VEELDRRLAPDSIIDLVFSSHTYLKTFMRLIVEVELVLTGMVHDGWMVTTVGNVWMMVLQHI